MIQSVNIETVRARRIAFIPHTGPYQQLGPVFQKLAGYACSHGLFGPGRMMLGVYYDNPRLVEPDKLRAEAGLEVDASFSGDAAAGVAVKTLPGGRYAVAMHKGPYAGLEQSYLYVFGEWLPKSGQQLADAPCYEVYMNNPTQTPPEELLTAIHVMLK